MNTERARDLGTVFTKTGTALLSSYVAGSAVADGAGRSLRKLALFVAVTKAASGSAMTTATVKVEALDADGNAYVLRNVLNDASATGAIEPAITAPSAGATVRVLLYVADVPPNAGLKVSAKLNATGVAGDTVTVKALAY